MQPVSGTPPVCSSSPFMPRKAEPVQGNGCVVELRDFQLFSIESISNDDSYYYDDYDCRHYYYDNDSIKNAVPEMSWTGGFCQGLRDVCSAAGNTVRRAFNCLTTPQLVMSCAILIPVSTKSRSGLAPAVATTGL